MDKHSFGTKAQELSAWITACGSVMGTGRQSFTDEFENVNVAFEAGDQLQTSNARLHPDWVRHRPASKFSCIVVHCKATTPLRHCTVLRGHLSRNQLLCPFLAMAPLHKSSDFSFSDA